MWSYNHLAGVVTVLCQELFAVKPWVQICFIITMLVFNRFDVKKICGISLSFGILLIHNHPDGVVTFLFAMFTAAPLTCQGVPDGNR